MHTITHTHHADVDPAAVWAVLADVDGWGAWNPGIAAITLSGPLAVGATFSMTPSGQEPLSSTIADLVPGRRLTDVTEVDGLTIRVAHELEAVGGGTTITYRLEVTGPAADTLGKQVGAAVSADFADVMVNLAAAARR